MKPVSSLQSWRRKQGRKRGTNQHSNQWDQSLFLVIKGTLRIRVDCGVLYMVSGTVYFPILSGMYVSSKSQTEIYCRTTI